MDEELKKLLDEQAKTFEEFKSKNDQALSQVKKLGEDAVTKDELKKLNDHLDNLGDQIKAADKANADIEAKMNRLALSGGPAANDDEVKAAREFGEMIGRSDFTVEKSREWKSAMRTYLSKNDDRELKAITLSVGVDPSGGYLVTPDRTGRMVKKIYETTPMRQICNVVQIGTDALEGPVDNGEFGANWVGEQETRSQTDASQLGIWRIPANELYAYPLVTQKLLEDASMDVEAWIAMKAADKFARKENNAFVVGDGVRKPKGLFSQTVASTADATRAWGTVQYVATGTSADFGTNGVDNVIDLIASLKAAYRQNARFLTNRATVAKIRKFKDGQGRYLWEPSTQVGQPASLQGYAIMEGEDVPAIAANSYSMAFGDFNDAYTIVDRVGITLIRDPYTVPGFVKFAFRKRTGGDLTNSEAVKFLKFGTS